MPPSPTSRDARAAAWKHLHHEDIDDAAALAFHVRATWGLERSLARLSPAGIPALVVKGAILAHWLYESPVERPLRDVNLRVRPADLERAVEAIASEPGARVVVASSLYKNAVLSIRGVEIDLEATIGPPFVCAVGVAEMLASAEEAVEPLGFRHTRPEIHDHALLLSINVFKDHVLPGTASLEDLARIVRREEWSSTRFAARVSEAGCTTMVHVVARTLAESGAGDEAWGAIAKLVVPRRRAYAERMLSRLRSERPGSELMLRLASRGASDGRLRSLAALATAAVREATLVVEDRFSRRS